MIEDLREWETSYYETERGRWQQRGKAVTHETFNKTYDAMNSLDPEKEGLGKKEYRWATKYIARQADFKIVKFKL